MLWYIPMQVSVVRLDPDQLLCRRAYLLKRDD